MFLILKTTEMPKMLFSLTQQGVEVVQNQNYLWLQLSKQDDPKPIKLTCPLHKMSQ